MRQQFVFVGNLLAQDHAATRRVGDLPRALDKNADLLEAADGRQVRDNGRLHEVFRPHQELFGARQQLGVQPLEFLFRSRRFAARDAGNLAAQRFDLPPPVGLLPPAGQLQIGGDQHAQLQDLSQPTRTALLSVG